MDNNNTRNILLESTNKVLSICECTNNDNVIDNLVNELVNEIGNDNNTSMSTASKEVEEILNSANKDKIGREIISE